MMKINTAKLIFFSPTHTTRRVVENIAQGIQVECIDYLDLTPPGSITCSFEELRVDLVIIGMPVYGGRIPSVAVNRLRRIKGRNTPAVIVVVYGNRAYEDALLELNDLVLEIGCRPVAGGAFIGEHSYSTASVPIACGRPNNEDMKMAADFGRLAGAKLRRRQLIDGLPSLHVPGNYPYKEYPVNIMKVCPLTDESLCQQCGECVSVCPTAAVVIEKRIMTDPAACILCCACVKACPVGARVMDNPPVNYSRDWLSTNCREPKTPEIYL